MSTRRPTTRKWSLGCLLLCLCVVATPWLWICHWPTARVELPNKRRCTLEFCRWYSGACVLSCYQNDVRTGTVDLVSGMLEHPLAIFPGPDGNTVVCFSRLDTTYATFAVDVTQPNDDPQFTRLHLQASAEPVIKRSDFAVRACTGKEVAFVTEYIKTTDLKILAKSVKGEANAETKEWLLDYLAVSTKPYNAKDPVAKFARPQILPSN